MKAKMRENLIDRYKEVLPHEFNESIGEFLKSIEGREVDLTFTHGDAFDERDNNIWLPDCLWDEV